MEKHDDNYCIHRAAGIGLSRVEWHEKRGLTDDLITPLYTADEDKSSESDIAMEFFNSIAAQGEYCSREELIPILIKAFVVGRAFEEIGVRKLAEMDNLAVR